MLVTLPNFGDERAIANTLRWAGLDVPVLVHAFDDDMTKMDLQWRRDSFCGKMSACNNLHQYGIKFSLTSLHTMDPESAAFRADLNDFAATCRVVRGLRGLRIGFLGARPPAFNTVRFSEKLLERSGISVETLDLSDAYGRIGRLTADSPKVKAKLEQDSRIRPHRQRSRRVRSTRWHALASSSTIGWPKATSRPRPFSAGPPWRSFSASFPAP